MTFWTSRQSGILPKWVFFFHLVIALALVASYLNLLRMNVEPLWTGGEFVAIGIYLLLTFFNWVRTLFWLSLIGSGLLIMSMALVAATIEPSRPAIGLLWGGFAAMLTYSIFWTWFFHRNLRLEISAEFDSLPSPTDASDPAEEFYAEELAYFESQDVDDDLWKTQVVIAEGDQEKAKWAYIKIRAKNRLHQSNESLAMELSQAQAQADEEKKKRNARLMEWAFISAVPIGFIILATWLL